MIFRHSAQIMDEQILAIGDSILKECTEERVEIYLKTWGPWMKYQRSLIVTRYDQLPISQVESKEQPECSVGLIITSQPVLYQSQIYDYKNFVTMYRDTGLNPFTRQQLDWSQLKRLKGVL